MKNEMLLSLRKFQGFFLKLCLKPGAKTKYIFFIIPVNSLDLGSSWYVLSMGCS